MPKGYPGSGKGAKGKTSDRNGSQSLEMGGVSFDKQKRLDCSAYQAAHPDKKFCFINDMDGEVEKYINNGFDPVERMSIGSRKFEGITDRHEDKWERRVVGTHEGGATMHAYLLMIDAEEYGRIKIQPQVERNAHIQRSMGLAAQSGEADASARDGSGLETYAANLPTGGQGFNQLTSS